MASASSRRPRAPRRVERLLSERPPPGRSVLPPRGELAGDSANLRNAHAPRAATSPGAPATQLLGMARRVSAAAAGATAAGTHQDRRVVDTARRAAQGRARFAL